MALLITRRHFRQPDRLDSEVPGLAAPIGHGLQEGGRHGFRPQAVDGRGHQDAQRDLPDTRCRKGVDPLRVHEVAERDDGPGDRDSEPDVADRRLVDLVEEHGGNDDGDGGHQQDADLVAEEAGHRHDQNTADHRSQQAEHAFRADRPSAGGVDDDVDGEDRPVGIFEVLTEASQQRQARCDESL